MKCNYTQNEPNWNGAKVNEPPRQSGQAKTFTCESNFNVFVSAAFSRFSITFFFLLLRLFLSFFSVSFRFFKGEVGWVGLVEGTLEMHFTYKRFGEDLLEMGFGIEKSTLVTETLH